MQDSQGDPPSDSPSASPSQSVSPLRVWPALVLITLMVVTRYGLRWIEDGPPMLWMVAAFGPILCSLLILIWWLTFSRARWWERLIGLAGIVLALVATVSVVDKTMVGPPTIIMTIPMGMVAFALGTCLVFRSQGKRRLVLPLLLAACGFGASALFRNQGIWGDNHFELTSRFSPTREEQLVAAKSSSSPSSTQLAEMNEVDEWLSNPEWSAFRGNDRLGVASGQGLLASWETDAPELLWKMDVGPGWSSFAIAGDLIYTQEQRGDMETVVCYQAKTGEEIWAEGIPERFEDTLGGPGPRATPTIAQGSLFVQSASGQIRRMDAKTGSTLWEMDLRDVANRQPPEWGFSASPVVVGTSVITYAGGADALGTIAFDIESGELKWTAPAGDHSYASPQAIEIAGQLVVAMLTNQGLDILDPDSGERLLAYEWQHQGYRSLQPAVVGKGQLLLPTGMGTGTRSIELSVDDQGAWKVEEQWTSMQMKPDFNDMVVHDGHAYGFDGSIFACIDLSDGERAWKRGRYGKGQVLLLRDIERLLVITERGEVVLLKASPEGHQVMGEFQAIEGKTWNHPVVISDRLYLRNSKEAACYRLPREAT